MRTRVSVKKNYIYNLSYQIVLLLTPFITSPYLSRVLEADGIGAVSFAESIVSYFTLFAALGIATYGQREIAYVQSNKEKRTETFWNIKSLQFITALIALLVYIPFSITQSNKSLLLVLIFNILAVGVDVTWFFQGVEEFGLIAFRNIFFRVVNICFTFLFVKSKDDMILYAFGLSFFTFISNASLWIKLKKYVSLPSFKKIKPFFDIKTVITLFIPTIAIQIYTVLDKTMIGVITKDTFENGYYEQAMKITKVALAGATSLGTVLIPRVGAFFGEKNIQAVKATMYKAYRFVLLTSIPLSLGLFCVSTNFVPWFFGKGYDKVSVLLKVFCGLIIAIAFSNATGMVYLIPTKRQNLLTRSVIIGACVNFALNCLLIVAFKSIGAAIASVIAETVIACVQFHYIRKELSIKKILLSGWRYYIGAGVMMCLLLIINKQLTPSIIHTLEMILIGATVYLFIIITLKDDFVISNIRRMLGKITTLLRRKQ